MKGLNGPAVSVVLPVLNEAKDMRSLLDQLKRQVLPDQGIEVLVVDGGSVDGTREIVSADAASWPPLRLLDNPRKRSSSGRNIGARAACGKYVLFLDGHCSIPRDDYLVRMVEICDRR